MYVVSFLLPILQLANKLCKFGAIRDQSTYVHRFIQGLLFDVLKVQHNLHNFPERPFYGKILAIWSNLDQKSLVHVRKRQNESAVFVPFLYALLWRKNPKALYKLTPLSKTSFIFQNFNPCKGLKSWSQTRKEKRK